MKIDITKKLLHYYEDGYKKLGASYQRKYPNEELCRFMGRNYFHINRSQRKNIKILEAGCGTGGNLCMLADEGFNTYGIDFSSESIKVLKKILLKKKLKANLFVGNMIKLPFKSNIFNAVVDIFSSTHLNKKNGKKFIRETSRVLKKNGLFFSYFPSKKSLMFKSKKKKLIDSDTIIYLNDKKYAYRIKNIPFRFMSKKNYILLLKKNKIKTIYSEEIEKTYNNGNEKFSFICIAGKKI